MNWSFSAQIERFEGEGHMHFLALPKALVGEGAKRFITGTRVLGRRVLKLMNELGLTLLLLCLAISGAF